MAEPKNKKNELHRRLERRGRVAARYLAGRTQAEIGEQVGVSQMTGSNDRAGVRAGVAGEAVADLAGRQAEEVAKLAHVEARAWAAWGGSCAPAGGVPTAAGDPRYLELVCRCIEARLKVLGLVKGAATNIT